MSCLNFLNCLIGKKNKKENKDVQISQLTLKLDNKINEIIIENHENNELNEIKNQLKEDLKSGKIHKDELKLKSGKIHKDELKLGDFLNI